MSCRVRGNSFVGEKPKPFAAPRTPSTNKSYSFLQCSSLVNFLHFILHFKRNPCPVREYFAEEQSHQQFCNTPRMIWMELVDFLRWYRRLGVHCNKWNMCRRGCCSFMFCFSLDYMRTVDLRGACHHAVSTCSK